MSDDALVADAPITLGTYLIPESNLPLLTDKIDKLARKAARLGLPPISMKVGDPTDYPYRNGRYPTRLKKPEEIASAKEKGRLIFIRFFPVEVHGTKPRLAGWTFVGTLQHLADDEGKPINLLRTVPAFKGQLPTAYRTATPENCDHCQKVIRTRRETFIVQSDAGEFKQIGRSCTRDFLGGADPQQVASYLEALLRACDDASGYEDCGFGGDGIDLTRLAMEDFLVKVAALVRVDGWCSRGRARLDERLRATASDVLTLLNPPKDPEARARWKAWAEDRKPTEVDIATAEKALAHARDVLSEKPDRNDYEHNLYVATTQSTINHKLYGITASLIPYYLREIERLELRKAEAKRGAASVFFGEVGKRADYYVTCTRVISKEGNFGTTLIHSLVTRDGNIATWFASTNPEMEIGTEYRVAATVKKHDTFRGAQQTILTRVSVYINEGRKLAEEKDARRDAKSARGETKSVSGETPVVDDETISRRKAAAAKAVATRRARAGQTIVTDDAIITTTLVGVL